MRGIEMADVAPNPAALYERMKKELEQLRIIERHRVEYIYRLQEENLDLRSELSQYQSRSRSFDAAKKLSVERRR